MKQITKFKSLKFNKITLDEFKRIFYYMLFNKLPYKDHFFFRTVFKIIPILNSLRIYIYAGKYWFKLKLTVWRNGFSLKNFTWAKKVSIYTKKKKK